MTRPSGVATWVATAAVQFWYQQVTSQRMPATNIIDLDLHLVKVSGSWKIDEEHWRFAPGGGP